MARYFFDLTDDDGLVADDEGMELAGIEAVHEEAARTLGDIAREEVRKVGDQPRRSFGVVIDVRDDKGAVLKVTTTIELARSRQVN